MLNIVNGKIILDLEYSKKPDGKEPTVRKITNFFPTIFLENIRKVGFFSNTLYIFSARPLNRTLLSNTECGLIFRWEMSLYFFDKWYICSYKYCNQRSQKCFLEYFFKVLFRKLTSYRWPMYCRVCIIYIQHTKWNALFV